MDFVTDGLATGRMVRILTVVDAYTRECLALEADFSLGSGRVTRVLERAISERGRPEQVRSDNGRSLPARLSTTGLTRTVCIWTSFVQEGRWRTATSNRSTVSCATSV